MANFIKRSRFFSNKKYYIKHLKEKSPTTVFYSTIMHLDPRKYRSSKDALPGFTPIILGGLICFDFDSDGTIEGLDEAKNETLEFLQFLKKKADIKYLMFSGGTGFHIVIKDPIKLPDDIKQRKSYMKKQRKLYIQGLINEYGKCPFDRPIAEDIYRFIRAPGTVNKKTGYIATIIDEEVLKLPIKDFLDNVSHVSGKRPAIPTREMTKTPPFKRKGDGKRTGQSFHLQVFITNKVGGIKDRFVPMFVYKNYESLRWIDRILKRTIKRYKLTDVYLFRDAAGIYGMCLKTFPKKRLKKIMKASFSDNRNLEVLRVPISERMDEEGNVVDKQPEFIGKIEGIKDDVFVSMPHLRYIRDNGIIDNYKNMHGNGFKLTKSKIRVGTWHQKQQ